MNAAPVLTVPGNGFERFLRHCARYWAIAPRLYPRGVFKYHTIEEAQAARTRRHSPNGGAVGRLPLANAAEAQFWRGIEAAGRFFMGDADVQKALEKLVQTLDALGISYAIIGAMALNEFGYRRTTVDVDVLLTPEGLAAFKKNSLGRGYVERFPGSRSVRDTEHGVDIDIVLAGSYPGDGKPKPVAFPDPTTAAERGARVALLPLPRLLELKLASGITAPHRLKDLADVQEVIRILRLPRALASELDAFVRDKYLELWQAVQNIPEE